MQFTPISVPVILALLIFASTVYRSPMHNASAEPPATAGLSCDDKQADCVFLQKLGSILRNTRNIRAFKFPEPCRKCHNAELSQQDFADLPPTTVLSTEDTKFFLMTFGDGSSYIPGIQKAMPFFADYGFVLEEPQKKSIFLLSTFSKSVRLVATNPQPVLIANIDPLFPEIAKWLAEILSKTRER